MKDVFKNSLSGTPIYGNAKIGLFRRRIYDKDMYVIGTYRFGKVYDLNNILWGTLSTETSGQDIFYCLRNNAGTAIGEIRKGSNILLHNKFYN